MDAKAHITPLRGSRRRPDARGPCRARRRGRPAGRRRRSACRHATKRSGRTRIAPSRSISRWRSQRAARVEEVAVEVADPQRVERQARLGGERARRLAPRLAVLAGDQQEAAGRDEVLDRAAVAVLVVDPGVRQRRPRARRRRVDADVVDRLGRRAAVGHDGGGVVGEAVLDVELGELHRLRADLAQDAASGARRPRAGRSSIRRSCAMFSLRRAAPARRRSRRRSRSG